MIWTEDKIQKLKSDIALYLPENLVIPRHTDRAHFYEVDLGVEQVVRNRRFPQLTSYLPSRTPNPVYPSVTGKLQILKDESLINHKMNLAIQVMSDYMFTNFASFTSASIVDHITAASAAAERAPADRLEDAGTVGTTVHQIRENYFRAWIQDGVRPRIGILDFYDVYLLDHPEEIKDVRAISALRALEKFLNESYYRPVACELLVYDHGMKVSGTLDDLGFIHKVIREGHGCPHTANDLMNNNSSTLFTDDKGFIRCNQCQYKAKWQFVLMDLKTSNAFKDHYFFQVSLYYWMFKQLTGYRPERCFILKVSKEDGRYKIEDLYKPSVLASYARSMVRTHKGVTSIKELRTDNQRTVLKI